MTDELLLGIQCQLIEDAWQTFVESVGAYLEMAPEESTDFVEAKEKLEKWLKGAA